MKKFFIASFTVVALIFLIGAGVDGLERFNRWDIGNSGSVGYPWVRASTTGREGMWTNSPTMQSARFIGGDGAWLVNPQSDELGWTNTFTGASMFLDQVSGVHFFYGVSPNNGYSTVRAGTYKGTNYMFMFTDETIATNSTVNSNITINLNIGKRNLFLTNSISLTNITGTEEGVQKSVEYRLTPVGHNRAVVYPTLGSSQFGVRIYTNANNPVWTTLTNGSTYLLVISGWYTNLDFAISEWK